MQRPEILVLDEPTSALDFGNQQRTLGIIDRLLGRGFSVVMTTHAPNQALRLGGRVALVGPDREFSCGQASGLLTGERLSRLYATAIRVWTCLGCRTRSASPAEVRNSSLRGRISG